MLCRAWVGRPARHGGRVSLGLPFLGACALAWWCPVLSGGGASSLGVWWALRGRVVAVRARPLNGFDRPCVGCIGPCVPYTGPAMSTDGPVHSAQCYSYSLRSLCGLHRAGQCARAHTHAYTHARVHTHPLTHPFIRPQDQSTSQLTHTG